MKKKQKLGKYEKGIIITGVAVLIIFLILLTADGIKNIGKNNNPIALSEQEIVVPPNVPVLSAGMIPVKYNGDNLIICKNDNSWYNYEEGKPAYMMLNDGVYQSELTVDMTNKKLASEHIGQTVATDELGTIYMWIPRYAKNAVTGEIKYVEQGVTLGENFEVSDAFMYKQTDETKPDFSLSGIWVEKTPGGTSKISRMTGEDNSYGFIANTIGVAVEDEDKTTIEDYIKPEVGTQGDTIGASIARPSEGSIDDPSNKNRTILKVINDKYHEPIKAKVEHKEAEGIVEVTITYNKYEIVKIEDRDGNGVSFNKENGMIKATAKAKAGKNNFTITDEKGNKKKLEVTVVPKVYAAVYNNDSSGKERTLVFTSSNRIIEEKSAYGYSGIWDITNKNYNNSNNYTPWYYNRNYITTVEIADEIAPTDVGFWFYGLSNLTNIVNIENLDTSMVTDMDDMFRECGITNLDLSSWNMSNVASVDRMFYSCSSLTSLNLSNWDLKNVTKIYSMFYSCSSLTSIDLSNWNISNLTYIDSMFSNCSSLTSIDLSSWDTSNVTDMGNMFYRCSSLTSIDLNSWDTSNVTDMSSMFYKCSSLTSLNLSSWDTSNVIDMGNMFYECSSLTSLNLSNLDTSNVKFMNDMFYRCSSLTELDLSSLDTSNVTNMSDMFMFCSNLTSLDLSNWNTSNVTYMNSMFRECSSLTELDLTSFNTAKVNSNGMHYMFYDCKNLTIIKVNPDIWHPRYTNYTFSGCGTSTVSEIRN